MTRAWVRPVVAVSLAVVLASVGGIAGRSLATPREAAEPVVVQAQISQPLPARDVASQIDFVPTGSREVPIGVTADTIRADVAAFVTAVGAALDPQSAAADLAPRYGLIAGVDACGIGAVDGCPVGAPATVGSALPPVRIRSALISPSSDQCDSTVAPVLAVVTNQPVTVTVDYWAATESAVRVVDETDAAERANWDRELPMAAASGFQGQWATILNCVPLPPLAESSVHTAHVHVVGVNGTRDSRQLAFDPSGAAVRPPAVVFAPTPDLIAVTVPHRQGETVVVSTNVLNADDDPACDPVVAGYDLFVRQLVTVTSTMGAEDLAAANYDPAFAERTTIALDVNEGITMSLCVDVRPVGFGAVQYHAETIVETADRLLPSVSVDSVAGLLLPDWSVRGYLPGGQRCGEFRVPGFALYSRVAQEFRPSRVLCDTTDVLGSGAAAVSPGRGVLPLSFGDRSAFTVEIAYGQAPVTRTSLDLGRAAECRGSCLTPLDSYYPVQGSRGSAVVRVVWSQGNRNGATSTTVAPVVDTVAPRQPGVQLDVGTALLRQSAFAVDTRSAQALLRFRADEGSAYVARLVAPDGGVPCTRPGAVLERTGILSGEIETDWTGAAAVTFDGLCAGAEYQAVIELTDGMGRVTTWGPPGSPMLWGAASRVVIRPMVVPLLITYRLNSDAYFSGESNQAAFLTLRAGELTVVGPHAGGCFGGEPIIFGEEALPALRLDESIRLSGSVQAAPASLTFEGGCEVDWASSKLALTFEVEFTLDELLASPEGIVVRVDQPLDADPSVRAAASAIIRIEPAS
ncbi:MAG: hypothetical protein JWP85_1979 [Rhodoglobus sp.]|nr:hypothetical protein [Rhodoglobus sp.]